MNRGRRRVLAASLSVPWGFSVARAADERALDTIDDLRALLERVAAERTPLIVLFSTPGCPYCLEVRRNYLLPRLRERTGALIGEVDITSTLPIRKAEGSAISSAEWSRQMGVRVVPTVLLLGARGEPLVEPLIGIDRAGFYESRLQSAIEAATARLAVLTTAPIKRSQ